MKSREISQDVTKKEMFHYSMLGVAECVVFCLWNNYMMMFYTDVFLLPPIFVSGLFLLSRIWDGINDPLLGMVAERTKTRWGRFKNYMLFMPVLLAIAMILNFTIPDLTGIAAMVYASITYLMMGMVYTTVDVSFFSLPTVMTTDNKKRTTLFGLSRLSTGMAQTIFSMMIIPCVQFFGQGDMAKGFLITAIVYSGISCILYFFNAPKVYERIIPEKTSFNLKQTMRAFTTNKPLMMIMLLGFIVQLATIAKSSMNIYYVTYNLNDVGLMATLGLVSIPGMLLGSIIAPILIKRFEKKMLLSV